MTRANGDQAETARLRRALLALFLDAEQIAVTSHEIMSRRGCKFSDVIWRRADPRGFAVAKKARDLLGLRPFARHGARPAGFSIRKPNGTIR